MGSMKLAPWCMSVIFPALFWYGIVGVAFLAIGVRSNFAKNITVDQSGGGDFTTVQAAIDCVPEKNSQWTLIHVKAGTYSEKVRIPFTKPFICIEGEGRDQTTIVWGDHVDAVVLSPTEDSATFTVLSSDFIARDISFKNSFTPVSMEHRQAVAATIGGDRSALYRCGFYGLQDTLNDYLGRHFYQSCYIEGAVDFIFGFGQTLFQDCDIVTKQYGSATINGTITAQGREEETDSSGFVFNACRVNGTNKTYLGRPWRSYSRVIFSNTTMSDIILPEGWDAWGQPTRNIFYAENACSGPGSNIQQRVKWEATLTPSQIKQFVSMDFIDQDKWVENQPS